MGDNFTPEQRLAIDTIDKSVLVSAAAGSGKTRVLIERIVDIILKGKADVDEMLVVTFTNAAAAEMRLRLAAAIKDNIKTHPENRAKMREQRDKLYRAYISTFNSFAIRIIKEFFYTVDTEPDFKVCDEVQATMLQMETVDELFDEAFAIDDLIEGGSFREFLRLYSSDRTEDAIKESIIASYTRLRSMPDYFAWAHERAELLKTSADNFKGSELENMLANDLEHMLAECAKEIRQLERLCDEAGIHNMYEEKLLPERLQLEAIENKLNEEGLTEELFDTLNKFDFPRLVAKKEYKEAWNSISESAKSIRNHYKDEIKGWSLKYSSPSLEKRLDEMNESYRYTEYYLKLLEEFERRFAEKKKALGMMDFSDMEHKAAAILKDDTVAETLRNRFKFIFVDEYQDTNHIQEHLINRIARPDNIFKVGDIKQSIYKFRQAEPEIFKETYRRYSEDREQAIAIDLSMNFRSNPATIKYINTVFEEIMDGYDEHAKLYAGIDHIPREYDFESEVHMLISDTCEDDESENAADEELKELSKEEAEAKYVAKLAAGLIGTDFYDSKAKVVRKVQAKDIVVLLRAVKMRGDTFSAAFKALDIQSHVDDEEDYFDTTEIRVALSLLMTIDNIKRDIPLIATMRSEILGFTTDELATIRAEYGRSGAYYEAVSAYVTGGSNSALVAKVKNALAKLEEWRALSNMMPLEDYIWKLLIDSEYYHYAGAMYGGARRQANLRTLVDRAAKFSEDSVGGLSDYIRYIEILKTKKVKSSQPSMLSKDDDVVRISTIHKSKGLEYPIVIVAGMGHRFRTDNNSKDFSYDANIGVGMPYVDPNKKYWRSTIIQRIINEKGLRDGYAEELRVLYVAMTRARNKLIIVGTEKNEEKFYEDVSSKSNYLRVMRNVISTDNNKYFIRPLERASKFGGAGKVKEILKMQENIDGKALPEFEEVSRRLEFKYPDEEIKTKAKYSVSELVRNAAEDALANISEEARQEDPRSQWFGKGRSSAAEIGTAYHRIMEFVDFESADEESIEAAAATLRDRGAIREDIYDKLDLSLIRTFFESEIGKRAKVAAEAGVLKKEKPFTLKEGKKLIQGIIDCSWEESGEIVLIDYKSNYINPNIPIEKELERIKSEYEIQIEEYRKAIEKGAGKPIKEAYLYMLTVGRLIKMM